MKRKRAWIPKYAIAPLLFLAVWNQVLYSGAMFLTRNRVHYNLETGLDHRIPFLPWTVSIYFACYIFWIVNYILAMRQEKKEAYHFFRAEILAKLICFVCFLLFPTTNIRPEITGVGIWEQVMRFLYRVDAASNLFPSIHCLVSWFCFIGVRGRRDIPKWYQAVSFLVAIAVFVSTLTTKQHVLADVAGGVFLAEVCYFLTRPKRETEM